MNADNCPAIPALLARLGDLHARATFGQWLAEQRESGYPKFDGGPVIKAWDVRTSWGMPVAMGTIAEENPANAALIAELRNAFPSLSSEIQRLQAENAELLDALVLVLPMASGYAAAHPVGDNEGKCLHAANVIDAARAARATQSESGDHSEAEPSAPEGQTP